MQKFNEKFIGFAPVCLLILIGMSARLLPHPANFTPITAVAIFGSLYLPKKYALIIPAITMLISDIFIGFYNPIIMLSVYSGFIIASLIALGIRKNINFGTILGSVILSSIIFFLLTNAAVCFFGTIYPRNLDGLFESYKMALPFFRNSLLGDLFYTGILVGGFEAIKRLSGKIITVKN